MNPQKFEEQQDGPLKNNDTPSGKGQQQERSGQKDEAQQEKRVSAERIDSIISSPTDAVHSRHTSGRDMGNTGTNVSYEGATAPGGGGSAGTGETSGQPATGSRITVPDPEEAANAGSNHPYNDKRNAEEEQTPEQPRQGNKGDAPPSYKDHDDNLGRETLGTP